MTPVVRLEVPILQVKEARTGETVGYGATHTLARDSRLAVLAIGYADGFFRALSSSGARIAGRAAIGGRVVPVIGRVSMDTIIVDITELMPDLPSPGDMAEILGPTLSVDDQADGAKTIGYEVLTSLRMGRFERHYQGEIGATA
jgi:alanine racemase